jgi:hypothetical protein
MRKAVPPIKEVAGGATAVLAATDCRLVVVEVVLPELVVVKRFLKLEREEKRLVIAGMVTVVPGVINLPHCAGVVVEVLKSVVSR